MNQGCLDSGPIFIQQNFHVFQVKALKNKNKENTVPSLKGLPVKSGRQCVNKHLIHVIKCCAELCLITQSCPKVCTQGLWGFSRQEYWSGLPCPPPGNLPNPGIEPRSPTLQADSLPKEWWTLYKVYFNSLKLILSSNMTSQSKLWQYSQCFQLYPITRKTDSY